jgi:F-type H+-transporting ATPase subunit delta
MTEMAKNFARALFELETSEDSVQKVKNIILDDKDLLSALSNPAVKRSEKHAVIDSVFEKDIRNFLKVLTDHDSMDLLKEIIDAYDELVLNNKNLIRATLTFVTKPDEDQIEKIREMVRRKYNKSGVLLELKEDSSLIGGFILAVGNTIYDKSIQGTLSSLYKTLVWR